MIDPLNFVEMYEQVVSHYQRPEKIEPFSSTERKTMYEALCKFATSVGIEVSLILPPDNNFEFVQTFDNLNRLANPFFKSKTDEIFFKHFTYDAPFIGDFVPAYIFFLYCKKHNTPSSTHNFHIFRLQPTILHINYYHMLS